MPMVQGRPNGDKVTTISTQSERGAIAPLSIVTACFIHRGRLPTHGPEFRMAACYTFPAIYLFSSVIPMPLRSG